MQRIVIDNIVTSYYITEDGKCYNSITNNWLKGQENHKNTYFSYTLTMPDGTKKRRYAHRLVAEAYIPNDDPQKNQINHIDGNKSNNCVDNLEWVTQKDTSAANLRKSPHVFCFTRDKRLVAEYLSIGEASKATKTSYSLIQQELNKTIKALSGGFYWSSAPELGRTIEYKNTGKAKPVNQYTKEGKYIMTYPSTGVAAKAINGHHSRIGECCRNKVPSYKGYVWRYTNDIVSPLVKAKEDVRAEHL